MKRAQMVSLGLVAAFWALLLQWIPIASAAVFAALQELALAGAVVLGNVAAWFKASSNEPHEKVVWGLVSLLALGFIVVFLITGWYAMAEWLRVSLVVLLGAGVVFLSMKVHR